MAFICDRKQVRTYKNIKLLNECNSTMTTRQKILYILENEENIFDVIKNSTKI